MSFRDERGFGLVAALVLSSALLIIATALTAITLSNYRYQHRAYLAAKATNIAEAGADYAIWKLNQPGNTYTGETGTSFGGGTYDVMVTNSSGTKTVTVTARVNSGVLPVTRKVRVTLSGTPTDQASFFYGVQVGAGGLRMSNSSKIIGNVYANGNATATNTASVVGDLWVAGSSGTISGFDVNKSSAGATDGNAHAHSITGSNIERDAFYQSLSSTTVGGTKHPGSTDPPPTSFAISNDQIEGWKADATSGGTQSELSLYTGTTSIGPKKINGSINLSNSAVLRLTGPVYATGGINLANSAIIEIDPSFGESGVVIIADGGINVSNSAILRGSGNPKSHLLAISTGSGGINLSNDTKTDLFFAPDSWINISNNVRLVEMTGYGLNITNAATIQYDQGLASTSFSSGPGGRWTVTAWQTLH